MEIDAQTSNTDVSKSDDLLLIKRIKEGNINAFRNIVEKYQAPLFFHIMKTIGNKEESEDILMDTFRKAYENINSYNSNNAFSTWLYTISKNNCIDFIRKKRMIKATPQKSEDGEEIDVFDNIKSNDLNPESDIIKQEKIKTIQKAVSELPDRYRIPLEMQYFEELSLEEIADKLQIPMGTVKVTIFRAKEMLLNKLKNKNLRHEQIRNKIRNILFEVIS